VTSAVQPDVTLTPLKGEGRPITEWTTNFHLAIVAVDPYTLESSWILDTARRILNHFQEADIRVALMVTASAADTATYLGPLVNEFLVFIDEDRAAVKAFGLSQLPAFVHINQANQVEVSAEGWDPAQWEIVANNISDRMDWTRPEIPAVGDPSPFAGTSI